MSEKQNTLTNQQFVEMDRDEIADLWAMATAEEKQQVAAWLAEAILAGGAAGSLPPDLLALVQQLAQEEPE